MIKFEKSILEVAFSKIKNYRIIVLCSSGVDSIAMTHYLLNNKKRLLNDVDIFPIHFNHNLRNENNLMEASFRRFMSEFYPSSLYYISRNPNKSLKTEDDLRKFRLSVLRSFTNNIIITAHHLNDSVESYLLNTIRGKPEYLPIPFFTHHEKDNIIFCKPFLFTKKKDFIEYAEKNDLMKYVVEDSTNKITKGSRRNLIRNEILPIFEREKVGLEKIVYNRMKKRLMLDLLK